MVLTRGSFIIRILCLFLSAFAIAAGAAADWPQFRHDASRSGFTSEALDGNVSLQWKFQPVHAPDPAWRGEDTRQPYDYACHAIIAEGRVYFGSSATGVVRALALDSGREAWRFSTEGPVRFAPAYWNGSVFVISDDGYLYCLDAASGKLRWKHLGGPRVDTLIGNGRMISRWPARGGIAIQDDVLYYAAGIWPSEGIYLYALDPATGDAIWVNDTAGYIDMPQPHPTATAKSGVSAQGYLCVAEDTLLMPTGRANPAAFDLDTGAFRYFHLQDYNALGMGPFVSADGGLMFANSDVFGVPKGLLRARGLVGPALAVFPDTILCGKGASLHALNRSGLFTSEETHDRMGNPASKEVPAAPLWQAALGGAKVVSLIGAGGTAVAGTADGRVLLFDTASRTVTTAFEVEGAPLALAASDGCLVVGTDTGGIYCFGASDVADSASTVVPAGIPFVPDHARRPEVVADALQRMKTPVGWALVLGAEALDVAHELLQKSDFQVCVVVDSPSVAEAIQQSFHYDLKAPSARVTVFARDLTDTRLPNYFANVVFVGEKHAGNEGVRAEAARCLRPYGGLLYALGDGEPEITKRPGLDGAGEWTHQYADPANTICSQDVLVEGPLGMLWFQDNDLEMPSRHGRGPTPLFWNGLLFVEGLDGLRALDAYNGTVRWDYPLPGILQAYDQEHLNGAAITGSNFCLAKGRIFVRVGDHCIVLDAETGAELKRFPTPLPGDWGYIACDGETLYGSLYDTEHTVTWAFVESDMSQLYSESRLVFALDAETGAERWRFTPEHAVRNNTLAIGGGRVFLIDRPIATRDRRRDDATPHPPGALIALDAATGEVVWRREHHVFGTMLAVSVAHDALLMAYQATRFRLASEVGGEIAVLRASTGETLWEAKVGYESRPIINERTVYAQGGAWDLLTGEPRPFPFSRSYGCGIIASSRKMLAFRSATVGYWDLTVNEFTENYGGIRPGCWINALPVGGLLLVPEASNRCRCSYLNKATFALQPMGLRPPKLSPDGGVSPEPFAVALSLPGQDGAEIRYTLDGSSPSPASPRYTKPLRVETDATLTARAFAPGEAPGPVSTARYRVDPRLLPLDGPAWKTYDAPQATPPVSKWVLEKGSIVEMSNLFLGEAGNLDPLVDRPGTLRILDRPASPMDGNLEAELSSADDDGIGIAFRVRGGSRYYLWAMDQQRGFHLIAHKDNDAYRVLAWKQAGFTANTWYQVRVELRGPEIVVYLNGEEDLRATDGTWLDGSPALYSWGSTGARFRALRWSPAPEAAASP